MKGQATRLDWSAREHFGATRTTSNGRAASYALGGDADMAGCSTRAVPWLLWVIVPWLPGCGGESRSYEGFEHSSVGGANGNSDGGARAGRDGQGGVTGQGGIGASAGVSSMCVPGTHSDCACNDGVGTSICTPEGYAGHCDCTAFDPGPPPGCSISPDCGSCLSCITECLCRTSSEDCLGACEQCASGHVEETPDCATCPFRVSPTGACFETESAACACACGRLGGNCLSLGECPTRVTCFLE
jgi:hypothetical protein